MTQRATRSALLVLAALALPGTARGVVVEAGALGGWSRPDAAMAEFQFGTSPQAAWGGRLRSGAGPLDLGLRLWSAPHTQSLGLAGVEDPRARITTVDLTGRVRLARLLGQSLHATASAGRLALTYDPSTLRIPTGGGDVVVTLAPVHEWVAGAGMALERRLSARWSMDLEVEHRWFGLDTAHRAGEDLVESRERFGTWDVRVGWNWIHGR